MTALIIGADNLGGIPDFCQSKGFDEIIHWKGRKKGTRNKDIPQDIDLIICLYDFLEHRLTNKIKKNSKKNKIPCLFSKRSVTDLSRNWNRCIGCKFEKNCAFK